MKKIGTVFAAALEGAAKRGGDEPEIIERFVQRVDDKKTAFGPSVQIATRFVHQRPYALFRKPASICGYSRCELGDVLLIFKRIVNGRVTDHRATFLQAKKGERRAWLIAPHQAEFLRKVNSIEFTFGKKARTMGGFGPILFGGLRWPITWAHYLCLDAPAFSLVYDTGRVYGHRGAPCRSFVFANERCRIKRKTSCVDCDGFGTFMHEFTKPAGFGLDIVKDARGKDMVTIACKRVGLTVDPEEEWEDYFFPPKRKDLKRVKEGSEGFGVILITAEGPPEEDVEPSKSQTSKRRGRST